MLRAPNDSTPSAQLTERASECVWRACRRVLTVASIVGLAWVNVATLVDEAIHIKALSALRSAMAVAPWVTDAWLDQKLSNSLTHRYSTLKSSQTQIEARHLELQKATAERAKLVKRVSTKVVRRAVTNAVKNVSSFATEIIPGIGVAAIIALTASDLYDDCATLRDMNDLNSAFEQQKEDETLVCGMKVPSHW